MTVPYGDIQSVSANSVGMCRNTGSPSVDDGRDPREHTDDAAIGTLGGQAGTPTRLGAKAAYCL